MMKNRWVVALAGMLLMMSLGAIYSWSLYTQPLIYSFGWSMMTTTWAFSLIFTLQAGVFFVMGGAHSLFWAVTAYAVILLCYGGGFGTMPSFNADYFGTKHLGANYGAILTAWGAAGVAGPLFVAEVKDLSGAFSGALPAVATMLAMATLLPLFTKTPAPRYDDAQTRPDTVPAIVDRRSGSVPIA